jgi:hypothetical protein
MLLGVEGFVLGRFLNFGDVISSSSLKIQNLVFTLLKHVLQFFHVAIYIVFIFISWCLWSREAAAALSSRTLQNYIKLESPPLRQSSWSGFRQRFLYPLEKLINLNE